MPYTSQKFKVMGEGVPDPTSPTGNKPFALGSQAAIDLLESILPAEKGQAVPYVLMWEIDATTGRAQHARSDGSPIRPISMMFAEPPKFGSSINEPSMRFRERPPVSLERLSIKTENPRSIILYRTIDLNFTVHRPEIVFDRHIREDGTHIGDHDSWSSMVTPGQAFALEYGWSASTGVKNGILNGEGYADPVKGVAIPGREQIRFYVTNYTFQIGADSQIKFNIKGIELGESGLRSAFLVQPKESSQAPAQAPVKGKKKKPVSVDPYSMAGLLDSLLKKVHNEVTDPKDAKKNKKKGVVSVPFGKLIDVLFFDVIKKSFTDQGFEFKGMYVGCLNDRAGKPAPKYSGGALVSGKPISDFEIPLDEITTIFQRLMKTGSQLTIYNFMEPFFRLFSEERLWDRKGQDPMSFKVPQVIARTISRRNRKGKIEVYYYIFDVNTEFTKFSSDDTKKLPNENVTRADIRKIVNSKGVPFVSLVRANSFIESANFDTIQDPKMEAIFINRYFGDKSVNRDQKVSSPDAAGKEGRAPAAQQIFAPVIQGNITMLGNFALDTFALIWLDFGINRWDGPFILYGREDIIENGKFTTTLRVQSEGIDPLGTKSRATVI